MAIMAEAATLLVLVLVLVLEPWGGRDQDPQDSGSGLFVRKPRFLKIQGMLKTLPSRLLIRWVDMPMVK